ncbi:MAG: WG repeat-containing protein [Bacteroidia bacterium]|nr:WG repeat-containing protein [Bacteroidia bacterium]
MNGKILTSDSRWFTKIHRILILTFLAALTSCTPKLSPEEETATKEIVSAWIQIFNENNFSDYGNFQTDPMDFFGKPTPKTDSRNAWYEVREGFNRLDFTFDDAGMVIDSVGKDLVKINISLIATIRNNEEKKDSALVSLYLTRGPEILIKKVQGDLAELGSRLEAERMKQVQLAGILADDNLPNFDLLSTITETVKGDFADFIFASRVGKQDLLYVANQPTELPGYRDNTWQKPPAMGLADLQGKVILPIKYDLIYTFGTLAEDHAEIELKGKFGLVHSSGRVVLEPIYDMILPPQSPQQLVMVKKGKEFGSVDLKGQVKMGVPGPSVHQILDKFDFAHKLHGSENDFQGIKMIPLNRKSGLHYVSYVIPPAVFQKLGIAPAIMPVEVYDPGSWQSIEVQEKFNLGEEIKGIISILETWAFEPRYSYHDRVYSISSYDKDLQLLSSHELMKAGGPTAIGHYCEEAAIKWIGKDTLEARFTKQNLKSNPYREEPAFRYFVLADDGKVQELKSSRKYPFTEFARIDESYLKSCFCQELPEDEIDQKKWQEREQYYGEFWITQHYTVAAMEEMIEEIGDSYHDGEEMSPLDVSNRSFLRSWLEKVKGDEAKYLNRKHEVEAW